MITRIANLKHYNNVLVGRDLAKIFKEGHVYQVTQLMGEIMIKDLGEHAEAKWLEGGKGTLSQVILDGTYCLTKDENTTQLKHKSRLTYNKT